MRDSQQIEIATIFCKTPAGRLRTDGPFSGQRFRDEILIPALRKHECVVLELDGLVSLPSSFWEETMGGLVRAGFQPDEIADRIKIKTTDPLLRIFIDMAEKFVSDAAEEATRH